MRGRGVSEIIGVLIAVAVLVLLGVYLYTVLQGTHAQRVYAGQRMLSFENLKSQEALASGIEGDDIVLVNTGSVPIKIVRVWTKKGEPHNLAEPVTLALERRYHSN